MKHNGIFITLEGIDGCGKSTQARLLAKKLRQMGYDVLLTREPGGTPLGKKLRPILLHPDSIICPEAELLLYLADRAQHVKTVILPALEDCKIVISERFADSTIAYQAAGRGLPEKTVVALNRAATGGLTPDLTLLLDISPAAAGERRASQKADRLEGLEKSFHQRLAQGYRRLAKTQPQRIKIIKAAGSPEEVFNRILKAVTAAFPLA
jgi:dTMP kinase